MAAFTRNFKTTINLEQSKPCGRRAETDKGLCHEGCAISRTMSKDAHVKSPSHESQLLADDFAVPTTIAV